MLLVADLGEALDPLHPGLDRRDDWLIDVCTRRVLELVFCCCCFLSFGILDLRVHVLYDQKDIVCVRG